MPNKLPLKYKILLGCTVFPLVTAILVYLGLVFIYLDFDILAKLSTEGRALTLGIFVILQAFTLPMIWID